MRPVATLLIVHAHPDDEALFTAGTSLWYSELGYRVVLVTCTSGQLGLDQSARGGNEVGHDPESTRVTRAGELARSVALVGVRRHVSLGYGDSGLEGWPQNDDPDSFVNADVERVARVIAAIIDEEDAQVVVTYDENGYYGHPDHIQAHLVTRRAVEISTSARRLYYPVTPREVLDRFIPAARERGVHLPVWVVDAGTGTANDSVDVTIDATSVVSAKQASIAAHASQVDNSDLVTMDEELFRLLFGHEYYVLGWSRSNVAGTSDDLFGGLK